MSESILKLKGIRKQFPGVLALDNVDFDLKAGEIHALVGENGAGKTTLIKIISGVYQPDGGEIIYKGRRVIITSPRHAQDLGIIAIHQEPNLYPDLSVLENIYIGRQPTRGPFKFIDWKIMRARAKEIFQNLKVDIDLNTPVKDLNIASQQLIQIARALSQKAQVLIMDEPTSSLSQKETEALFDVVQKVRSQGVAIIYITHRLEEVFILADRVTVLRDGKYIGTYSVSEVSPHFLINLMVGRLLTHLFPKEKIEIGAPILRVRNLTKKNRFYNINFEVRKGEILGIAGLVGAGRSELLMGIFGAWQGRTEGNVFLEGGKIQIKSPIDAIKAGIGFVTEDRKRYGLIIEKTIQENMTLASLKNFSRNLLIDKLKEFSTVSDLMKLLRIKAQLPSVKVSTLSGGNQQKVVLGKWLLTKPKVLFLDEPTRGIDVAAKQEFYLRINELAEQGLAIVLVSSELPEILGLSDRILVMHEGKAMAEFTRKDATPEKIMIAATGYERKT
ncbi:MAG: sugar ABC transporter ATP-binding protein [Anaerolineae bacterium]|nr:sugar ABC transporter ATP-binding protein [Anaerolineae bacterium]